MMRKKRTSLIEERYYGIKRTQLNFMRMVQERVSKMKTSLASCLPNDLMFQIFLLLPIKTLLRLTCVCKSWKKMIHCAEFVEAYNNEAQTSAILMREIEANRLNTFHIETEVNQLESFSIFPYDIEELQSSKVFNFLEIEDGKSKIIDLNISCLGSIVATCNGLILISSKFKRLRRTRKTITVVPQSLKLDSHEKPGRLIIMNPMTRKFFGFPLGTLPTNPSHSESYGLVFSHLKGVYKVVHLYKDKLRHIACEVYSMDTRCWRAIDGPSETLSSSMQLSHMPIWASEALHWLPSRHQPHHPPVSPVDYIVSMGAEDERFFVTNLPKSFGLKSKLLEMGGFLSFVSTLDTNNIEVWMLKGLEGSEWIKQHTIQIDATVGYLDYVGHSTPVLAVNAKEMIFRRGSELYSYDFETEEARVIKLNEGSLQAHDTLMPLANNLATWEHLEPLL